MKKNGQEGQKKDPPWQSNPYSHLDMLHDLIVVLPNHREASSVATAPLPMPLGSLLIIHCWCCNHSSLHPPFPILISGIAPFQIVYARSPIAALSKVPLLDLQCHRRWLVKKDAMVTGVRADGDGSTDGCLSLLGPTVRSSSLFLLCSLILLIVGRGLVVTRMPRFFSIWTWTTR